MRVVPFGALKRTSTALGFLFFIFDLEYLIRVQSSEPLHAKMNPTSCLFGSRFACAQTSLFRRTVQTAITKATDLYLVFLFLESRFSQPDPDPHSLYF
jgi:hypothetical protein